jgi:hypothetical protein
MGIPNSIRILYKTSLLTQTKAFLKSTNSWCTVSSYSQFFSSIWRMQKIWSVVDLLLRNPHWRSQVISTMYGLNLERRIVKKKVCFISCVAFLLYNIGDWWVKNARCMYCNIITVSLQEKSLHFWLWVMYVWLEKKHNFLQQMLSTHAQGCSNLQTKTSTNCYKYIRLCKHQVILHSLLQLILYMENSTTLFNIVTSSL